MPDVDVDQIQARADDAVRDAIVRGAKAKAQVEASAGATGLARLQPHLNLDAANAPRPEIDETEEPARERSGLVWVALPVVLIAGALLWWWRSSPTMPDQPLVVPTHAAATGIELGTAMAPASTETSFSPSTTAPPLPSLAASGAAPPPSVIRTAAPSSSRREPIW